MIHGHGVLCAVRTSEEGADLFVVALADQAHPRWRAVADVVVHPAEENEPDADRVAVGTLRELSGCALVAVGVSAQGVLLRSRCGWVRLCAGDGSNRGTLRAALRAYRSLVWG